MKDKITRRWEYVTPLKTTVYHAGWTGTLPAMHRKAAEESGALETPKEKTDGHQGAAADRPARSAGKAEG